MAKQIKVELELLNKQYLQRLQKTQKQTARSTKSMAGGFKSIASAGIAFFAARGILSAMSKLIDITDEQLKQEKQLETVLKSTKGAVGLTATEIKKMASALQEVTTFGDETILRGQNMLLTFTKIGKDVFPQATETMLNMAKAMGQDVKQTAIQLGKALNDPVLGISALSRVGVQLSEVQKKQIKDFMKVNDVASAQKVILGELETQFGGSARAATETLGGALKQLKNNLGDAAEDIGKEMTPALTILIKSFGIAMKSGGALSLVFSGLGKVAGAVAIAIAATFIALSSLVNDVQKGLSDLTLKNLKERKDNILKNNKLTMKSSVEDMKKANVYEIINELQKKINKEKSSNLKLTNIDNQLNEQLSELERIALDNKKKTNDAVRENNKLVAKNIALTKGAGDKKTYDALNYIKLLRMQGKDEETQIAIINQKYDDLYNLRLEHEEDINKLKEAHDKLEQERLNKITQVRAINFSTVANQISGFTSQLGNVIDHFYSNENERIQQNFDARQKSIEGSTLSEEEKSKKLKSLDAERARATRKAAYDDAVRAKAFGIVEATIATAVSVAKALPNIPLAVLSGILGAAQITAIATQPLPSLDTGTMDVPTDTLANIHKGEIIIPKPFADGIRSGDMSMGGGGGDIIVQGSIIDYNGLMNAVDSGREKRAYGMGVNNYAGAGVYK